jgi:hypothetical protein
VVTGTREDAGSSKMTTSGSSEPAVKEAKLAPAACQALVSSFGSILSSASACAASGSFRVRCSASSRVGAAEATRRELTEADVERIVRAELAEREAAAQAYPDGPARPGRVTAHRDLHSLRVPARPREGRRPPAAPVFT